MAADFFDSKKDKITNPEKSQITSNKCGLFGGKVSPAEKFNEITNSKHVGMLLTQVNIGIDSIRANSNETIENSPTAKI